MLKTAIFFYFLKIDLVPVTLYTSELFSAELEVLRFIRLF
jgi:hypothetical protein